MVKEIKKLARLKVSESNLIVSVLVGEGKIGNTTVVFKKDPDTLSELLAMGDVKDLKLDKGSKYKNGKFFIQTTVSSLKPTNDRISVDYVIKGAEWVTGSPSVRESGVTEPVVLVELEIEVV